MTRLARDLGVTPRDLVRAALALPLVIVFTAGIWFLCAVIAVSVQ